MHGAKVAEYMELAEELRNARPALRAAALSAFGGPEKTMGSRLAGVDLTAKDTSLIVLTGVSLDVARWRTERTPWLLVGLGPASWLDPFVIGKAAGIATKDSYRDGIAGQFRNFVNKLAEHDPVLVLAMALHEHARALGSVLRSAYPSGDDPASKLESDLLEIATTALNRKGMKAARRRQAWIRRLAAVSPVSPGTGGAAVIRPASGYLDAAIWASYFGAQDEKRARLDATHRADELLQDPAAQPCVCFVSLGGPNKGKPCGCFQTGARVGGADGLRAIAIPCQPNEERESNMSERNDAIDTITRARAERDAYYAGLGRPLAERIDAKAEKKGANRARYDAEARAVRVRLGDPSIKRGDIKRCIRARGGDADLSRVDADGMRALNSATRAARAPAKRARAAAPAYDPGTGATPTRTNTDATDSTLTDVEAARKKRDDAYANAWRTL